MSDENHILTPTELTKIEAETERIRQEIEINEARRLRDEHESDARQRELNAKIQKIEIEARVTQEALTQAQFATRNMERTEKEMLAEDKHNNVYYFNTSVGEQSVRACMNRLAYWHRVNPGCDIEIIFNSPGGEILNGLALYDYIQEIKRAGHKVTTVALGMAASMAGILLQAGNERVMAKESWVLIHEVSTLAMGKIGEIEDEVKFVKRVQERVLKIFADGCKRAHDLNPTVCTKPLTLAALRKGWERKDWWLSSDEGLMYGLVDKVA